MKTGFDVENPVTIYLYVAGYNVIDKQFPDNLVLAPRPITLPLQNTSTKVIDMAAGRAHLLILTTEGLFTLGNNAYGQCGRPIILNENYEKSMVVHHIPDVKGNKITSVTAGQDHRYKTLIQLHIYKIFPIFLTNHYIIAYS